eukprot:5826856-Prymnesium_polylepis.1
MRTDQLSGWNAPSRSTTGGRGPPVHPPSLRLHLAPCSLPFSTSRRLTRCIDQTVETARIRHPG